MPENTGEGEGDQMQNYEEIVHLPTPENDRLKRSLKKSLGLRWKGCGRDLLFRNIKTRMVGYYSTG